MAIEEKKAEISWEEAVSRFLKETPDYFERNPHLLHQLDIPHPDTGQAVSLIERQVLALRQDNRALESQLGQLVDNATENDAVAGQLHRFTLGLMISDNTRQVIKLVTDTLKSRFNLDLVLLKLFSSKAADEVDVELEPYLVSAEDPIIKHLCNQLESAETVCGIDFSDAEVKNLFDGQRPEGSLALIPIQHERPIGLLIIGSNDDNRFVADMATTYLDRIGEMIGAAISRFADGRPGSS